MHTHVTSQWYVTYRYAWGSTHIHNDMEDTSSSWKLTFWHKIAQTTQLTSFLALTRYHPLLQQCKKEQPYTILSQINYLKVIAEVSSLINLFVVPNIKSLKYTQMCPK